jgi:hypothetical protein
LQFGCNFEGGMCSFSFLLLLLLEKKCKISLCGLPDLQVAPCSIKMNSKVPRVC